MALLKKLRESQIFRRITMGIRLQGTDGIRGPIQKHLPSTEHPVKWYLQTGEITPEFFQLYTYSTCSLLRNFGLTEISNSIVVGWDSRDSSDIFNNAAMLGILQAGLTPCSVGILPGIIFQKRSTM